MYATFGLVYDMLNRSNHCKIQIFSLFISALTAISLVLPHIMSYTNPFVRFSYQAILFVSQSLWHPLMTITLLSVFKGCFKLVFCLAFSFMFLVRFLISFVSMFTWYVWNIKELNLILLMLEMCLFILFRKRFEK